MPTNTMMSFPDFSLIRQWMVVVQTPTRALGELISEIESNIELTQGNYSHCMYVRNEGQTHFKNENGAYEDAENHVREVKSVEVVLMLPYDAERLTAALRCIRHHHVHEEPTIGVTETWSCLSGEQDDADNPNRYWNREDSEAIHGNISERY